ncbi:uncharacterized protein LOC119741009 isoform X1 [Patiria miniata]|uniref:Uncharacterized protein n=1 Tax=Patiria miniata TaxID=46514 RepID=A0A914B919_PATMI|nr:uncharacterized protein LOC119741009 isoform X1 [Patiria miniata]XP_038072495.1 uncharacterized protein LOC119741009 isoform X1 [Patiria miniata]
MGDEHPLTWTNSSSEGLAFQRINTKIADDIVMLFVIITSLVAAASGVMVIYGFWRSKRQHRRLRKVVSMDTNDFLLYAQIAQQEVSSAPCKTSLPFQMPYSGKNTAGLSSYPVIVPGYVRIVQITHPAAKEQNYRKGHHRSVVPKTENKDVNIHSNIQSLPKSTSSAPAILSGLWKQRHLLTGNKDTLVDSFTMLKKPMRQQTVRASLSDTSPMIDRSVDQSSHGICEECGSGTSSLAGTFPRNISCKLCRERAGIRDVRMPTKDRPAQEPSSLAVTNASSPASTTGRNTVLPTVTPPPKSPGRPKLSTFRDGRRKSCTPEVRAQLDPFRTMVLLSSSSEDLTSDSD